MLIGYAHVSTQDQNRELHREALVVRHDLESLDPINFMPIPFFENQIRTLLKGIV